MRRALLFAPLDCEKEVMLYTRFWKRLPLRTRVEMAVTSEEDAAVGQVPFPPESEHHLQRFTASQACMWSVLTLIPSVT